MILFYSKEQVGPTKLQPHSNGLTPALLDARGPGLSILSSDIEPVGEIPAILLEALRLWPCLQFKKNPVACSSSSCLTNSFSVSVGNVGIWKYDCWMGRRPALLPCDAVRHPQACVGIAVCQGIATDAGLKVGGVSRAITRGRLMTARALSVGALRLLHSSRGSGLGSRCCVSSHSHCGMLKTPSRAGCWFG